tara:strand:+ start:6041 stop:6904 length:864 start_codon:yes stop_codon:yes gene_type:complete
MAGFESDRAADGIKPVSQFDLGSKTFGGDGRLGGLFDYTEFAVLYDIAYNNTAAGTFENVPNQTTRAELKTRELDEETLEDNTFEMFQKRVGGTIEDLAAKGINYNYLVRSSAPPYDGFFGEEAQSTFTDSRPSISIYYTYSYQITAPEFTIVDSIADDSPLNGYDYDAILNCSFDGDEIATYDSKFGSINNSGSVSTILEEYINNISMNVVNTNFASWDTPNTVRTRSLRMKSNNLLVTPLAGAGVATALTGAFEPLSSQLGMGGSTVSAGGSSGGGGGSAGGGGY